MNTNTEIFESALACILLIICIFTQNSFQRISVIFSLLVRDVLKIAFSAMNLLYNRKVLYNRIILYNRAVSSLVLFAFSGMTFGVFDIIYFRLYGTVKLK